MKIRRTLGCTVATPVRVTRVVIVGSLFISIPLTMLLILYSIFVSDEYWFRSMIALGVIAYISFATILIYKDAYVRAAQWMVVLLYESLAFSTLLTLGLNAPLGILTTSFGVIFPSLLMGSRYILPVGLMTAFLLFLVHFIHETGTIIPDVNASWVHASHWDLLAYLSSLIIFGLVAWLSGNMLEQSLNRARKAEGELRSQKENLRLELERESAALRQAQVSQIQQLHKFALIGQSTAATLHELSNHLSVLNLDIDDLKQQHTNSRAVAKAEVGIEYLTKTIRLARQQLNSYNQTVMFNVATTVKQTAKDMNEKFSSKRVDLKMHTLPANTKQFRTIGDPFALMQIISILLNNALDACQHLPGATVEIALTRKTNEFLISIIDNGPGIDAPHQSALFNPHTSSKPSGLGIGLYIAYHIAQTHFNGRIELINTKVGAHFEITIPVKNKV